MKSKRHQGNRIVTASEKDVNLRALHTKLVEAENNRRSGKLARAEEICRSLLNDHPTYVGALQTFGLISLENENFKQAVTCFLTAAAEAPADATNFTNLGAAWLGLDVPRMAEIMLLEACRLNPDEPEIYLMLGDIYTKDRRYDSAIDAYRRALDLKPEFLLVMFKLGECYVDLGYFDEAKGLLLRVHKLRPQWISVIHLLRKLPFHLIDLDFETALGKAEKQKGETEKEFENNKTFLRAILFDSQANHKLAWKTIKAANAAIKEEHQELLQLAQKRQKSDLAAMKKIPPVIHENPSKPVRAKSCIPLFILGPSRAGKTTIEKLITKHESVKRGYENHMVEDAVIRASQKAGLVKLHHLPLLPSPLMTTFSEEFRNRIKAYSGDFGVVTNTHPGLIGSAGQLAMALPEARFVFVTRTKEDIALRIFMQKYKTGNHHAYDLTSIYDYINWYETMISELTGKLGDCAVHFTYEDIVANPAMVTGAALSLCGLDGKGLELPNIGSDVGAAEPYAKYLK